MISKAHNQVYPLLPIYEHGHGKLNSD